MRISDATILITGSSSGLGLACARQFLQGGAKILGIDLAPADPLAVSLGQHRYVHVQANVTDPSSIADAIHRSKESLGPLSGAICCAGILHGERLIGRDGAASLENFRRVIDINLHGTFNVVRLAAEAISKSPPQDPDGERGVIVMTSSVAAFDGQIGQSAYSASKGAIASMTLPLAREMGKWGIRVLSIAPGVFETPMMQAASERVRQPLLDQSIFPKRFGLPNEFAAMVQHVFENPMLNGTVLRLDGSLRM